MQEFKIICENNDLVYYVEAGASLLDLLEKVGIDGENAMIGAYVNNQIKDLNYKLYSNKSVKFIDTSHFEGINIYNRTVRFMLSTVTNNLFEGCKMVIHHYIDDYIYFEITGVENSIANCEKIEERLDKLSKEGIKIIRERIFHKEAADIYFKNNMFDKSRLLESSPSLYVTINSIGDSYNYLYGALAPSTNYISDFDVKPFMSGYLLNSPIKGGRRSEIDIHPRIFDVIAAHNQLLNILDVSDIGALNSVVNSSDSRKLIKIGEAFQERNFSALADKIFEGCQNGVKLVLISGPSSSGKTTFSNRLDIQLRVLGLKPIILSMDNYFVDREDTPLDINGKHDYESPYAVDIELFNDQLGRLTLGEEVELPRYDFMKGAKCWEGKRCKLEEGNILIIEGIHALNPIMTRDVASDKKYKIFIAPLTSISLDNTSKFDSADLRLIRRIVRDAAYRANSATQTLQRWGSVRRGEIKHILPFQGEADALFDTFLFFELSILKRYVEPLLKTVCDTDQEYSQARRLLDALSYIVEINDKDIPPTSLLREFIGGSSFEY